jgi:hexokinase
MIAALAIALVVALVWPAPAGRDSFPLSNYPMFAAARPAETSSRSAVGVDAAGEFLRLSPADIGGTDQVIQAAATIRQAVENDTTDELCDEIAERISGRAVAVEVVTERYDTIAWFDGRTEPIERRVHARCPVP